MNPGYTKLILANSLKELSKSKKLAKISIQEISSHCGLNRGTFYYHFADKDDLINWIFKNDILDYFYEAKEKEWTHNTYHFLSIMKQDCPFYSQALEIDSYYNLRRTLYTMNYDAAVSIIDNALNKRKLSDKAKEFIANFYAGAFTETNIAYLKNGAKDTPEKMLQYYYDISEPCIFIALEQFINHDHSQGMLPYEKGT